jgi:hypothetical protein
MKKNPSNMQLPGDDSMSIFQRVGMLADMRKQGQAWPPRPEAPAQVPAQNHYMPPDPAGGIRLPGTEPLGNPLGDALKKRKMGIGW